MMNWSDKRCLVTGAGGFIGSHLTARLVELGAKVRAVVRYNSRNDRGLLEFLPDPVKAAIEVRAGDLTDPFWTREAAAGCEIIFHLAALIAIPYSYTAPQQFLAVNGTGTLNLLEAARSSRGGALRAHLHQRDLRHGAVHPHGRKAPPGGPVALRGQQDRG